MLNRTYSRRPHDSNSVSIANFALANAATMYTEALPCGDNEGFSGILVTENKAGGLGTVAITAEYSLDGTNFYTNYTTSGGTLTADSAIVSALNNVTRYITHKAVLAKFMRYKFVAAADAQLTVDYIYQRSQ